MAKMPFFDLATDPTTLISPACIMKVNCRIEVKMWPVNQHIRTCEIKCLYLKAIAGKSQAVKSRDCPNSCGSESKISHFVLLILPDAGIPRCREGQPWQV